MHVTTRLNLGGLFLLVFGLMAGASLALSNDDLSHDPRVQTGQIVDVIEDIFAGEPQSVINTTIRVFMCESGLRNGTRANGVIIHVLANGDIRRGPDGKDIGAGQLRPSSHTAAWTKELDPTQIRDNVVYALKLQQGRLAAGQNRFADWYPSRTCWQQAPVTMAYTS